ncbi:MAG: RHS repeat-associated core domain-containing protein [Burkholderiales bacterium]|nr:RHS repeat-associated core domain-containing protein [Burkholderiales bacterium]
MNTIVGVTARHGYTGHEMLDEVGVINMNGRMYDPLLGRFMSADPSIQSPYNLQSYNRYAYAWNDPMGGIDPSGYSFLGDVFGGVGDAIGGVFHSVQSAWKDTWHSDVGRTAISIAVAYYTGGLVSGSAWASCTASGAAWGGIAAGTAGGFAAGVVGSGGDLNAGLQGAASGAMFGWAGGMGDPASFERYAAHAFAGCLSGEIGSGGCGRGAFSAVAGKWATNATGGNFVATMVAGGTVSVIGGGKFANGAETAAFGYLFNYCSTAGACTSKLEQALYDYWPGYKLGTCLNDGGCTAAQWGMSAGDSAIGIVGGVEGKGAKFAAQLEVQLSKDGASSIFKSLQSLENRLAEHVGKLDSLQYKSSVEREIRTFQSQIDTIKQFIKDKGI